MLEERARDNSVNWMRAVEILSGDIYLGAENDFNIFTVRKNSGFAIDSEEERKLEVEGEYHLGDIVNRFRHGSLALPALGSEGSNIATVLFGTINGLIGVIAPFSLEQYEILEKLQMNLVKVIKGIGGLSHEQWRSFSNEKYTRDAKKFIDGDLIESFLKLNRNQMEEIANPMHVPVEELRKIVPRLT